MPTAETLERFIARVEENAHAEACEEFHTPDSLMQENQLPPRVGRDLHVSHERKMLSRARSVSSQCVRPRVIASHKRPSFTTRRNRFPRDYQRGAAKQIEA